jgi:hypothetical protein
LPRGYNQSFLQCHKRIAQTRFDAGEEVKAFSQRWWWRVIEFLAQMPADTKIFLTMAVLGLAAVLNAQTAAPPSVVQKIALTAIVDQADNST